MRSRFADAFNHDADAAGYDADVRDEGNPVRAGYAAVLDWVAETCGRDPSATTVDLGAGTGNLTLRLGPFRRLTCVDVSPRMMAIGRAKLGDRHDVEWVQRDLLEFVHDPPCRFDVVAAAYSVHHLTGEEKGILFRKAREILNPGGRAVFGDLMFADRAEREAILARYRREGRGDLADEVEDEFFWDVETAVAALGDAGFRVETRRFSELSWGILARTSP